MVIILDANILITAALNIDGPYSKLLLDKASFIEFVVPEFIFTEIKKHELRICNNNQEKINRLNKNLLLLLPQILISNDDEV